MKKRDQKAARKEVERATKMAKKVEAAKSPVKVQPRDAKAASPRKNDFGVKIFTKVPVNGNSNQV